MIISVCMLVMQVGKAYQCYNTAGKTVLMGSCFHSATLVLQAQHVTHRLVRMDVCGLELTI